MNSATLIQRAKVMNNNTICLGAKITKAMGLKKGDPVILSFMEDGSVAIQAAPQSIDDLVGIGEETFKALGGGEAFLKSERASWGD